MKKRIFACFLALCLLVGLLPTAALAVDGQTTDEPQEVVAATIEGKDGTYGTIQAAIDAAVAGDKVVVKPGTYEETLTINKAVIVTGEDGKAAETIIEGPSTAAQTVLLSGGATLQNVTVTRGGNTADGWTTNSNTSGVIFGQSLTADTTLQNCIVTHNRNGVYLNNTNQSDFQAVIEGNQIIENRTGINMCNNVSDTVIKDNVIENNTTLGIVYYESTADGTDLSTITLTGNTLSDNWFGNIQLKTLTTKTSNQLSLAGNTFAAETVSISYGAAAEPGYDVQIPAWAGGTAGAPTAAAPAVILNKAAESDNGVLNAVSCDELDTEVVVKSEEELATALAVSGEGTIIRLTDDISLTTPISLPKGITLDGGGNTIAYTGNDNGGNPINGALMTVSADSVTIQNITIDTAGKVKHGVQFYCSDSGKLDGVTVNGGAYTSVIVNGATNVTVQNSTLNPDAGAYANIEYAMGQNVTTVPSVTVTDVTMAGSKVPVYVDEATITAVKNNTTDLSDAEDDAVLSAIQNKVEGAEVIQPVTAGTLQGMIDDAEAGAEIDLKGKYYTGTLNIGKSITLKNGRVDNVNVIGTPDTIYDVTLDTLTFMAASVEGNLDVNGSSLYVQNAENVAVKNCVFNGPAHADGTYTTAITTTVYVKNFSVENSKISDYTMSGYHNQAASEISYTGNTFTNIESGIAFDGTAGVTVTGNTFENANGIRLRSNDTTAKGTPCTEINIEKNCFNSVYDGGDFGAYAIRLYANGVEGELSMDRNYWGSASPDIASMIAKEADVETSVKTTPYYVNESMTRLNTDSTSSGGGSSTPSYTVTAPTNVDNGTITVSPKSASKGDTVTITVKPNAGYELDKLTVTDKDGKEVKLTDKGDGKYTFSMPASKVEIKASFSKIAAPSFSDVDADDYFAEAVEWAVVNGITKGTSATTFSPDASCTRAQMVTFLWRSAGSPAPKTSSNPFADVKADAYYYDAVLWAVENGITKGTSATTFSPDATVTRGQTVTFLYRAAGSPEMLNGAAFTDVAADAWYAPAIAWAVEQSITMGTSATTFSPDADCTRAQIVTFLFRSEAE
jgi:hypothetical protein